MAGRVIWSELARAEFEVAADYIGTVSAAYAATFVRQVLDAVERVARWPDSGAIVAEFDTPTLREVFVKRYRIIYRPLPGGVSVVAIVHSARDLPGMWDEALRGN